MSLHVIKGELSPQTIVVNGLLKNKKVLVLIDSRRTQSFVDYNMIRRVGLEPQPSRMRAMVADGSKRRCEEECIEVEGVFKGFAVAIPNFEKTF